MTRSSPGVARRGPAERRYGRGFRLHVPRRRLRAHGRVGPGRDCARGLAGSRSGYSGLFRSSTANRSSRLRICSFRAAEKLTGVSSRRQCGHLPSTPIRLCRRVMKPQSPQATRAPMIHSPRKARRQVGAKFRCAEPNPPRETAEVNGDIGSEESLYAYSALKKRYPAADSEKPDNEEPCLDAATAAGALTEEGDSNAIRPIRPGRFGIPEAGV